MKFARHFRNASLVHFLIVVPTARVVIHHRRHADGRIEAASFESGLVELEPPGLVLDLATLFPTPVG